MWLYISPTQWTWIWVDSSSWWCTGRPGVLQFMGSQKVGHDWATELNWSLWLYISPSFLNGLFICLYCSHLIFPTPPFSIIGSFPAAKLLQSCPTLCDRRDGSPPGSSVPGILQARTLEWVAISFSNAWKWKVKAKSFSRVWLFGTPWTAVHQALPSMGFSRLEYWSGVPLPSPGSFPNSPLNYTLQDSTSSPSFHFCFSLHLCSYSASHHFKYYLYYADKLKFIYLWCKYLVIY